MMGGARVEMVGVDLATAKMASMATGVDRAVARAVYEEAMLIFEQSQTLVPVRTGVLRASGAIIGPMQDKRGPFVEIRYGGAASAYALAVHENLTAAHNPPTQAKYLEQPVLEAAPRLAARVEARVKELLKG